MALEWCKVCHKTMEQTCENWRCQNGKPVGQVCRACHNDKQRGAHAKRYGHPIGSPRTRSPIPLEERQRAAARAQYADPEQQQRLKVLIAERRKERLKEDPVFKLATNLRSRCYNVLKAGSPKYYDWLGCTGAELRAHFEQQFEPEMTWENRKAWEIDHIVGLSAAKTEAEVLRLNHFTNLRPRWKADNRQWRKGMVAVSALPTIVPDAAASKTWKLKLKLARFQQKLEKCPAENRSLRQALQTNIEGLTRTIGFIEQLLTPIKAIADRELIRQYESEV